MKTEKIYKYIAAGALLLLAAAIVPLIYIGRYAHPCADDFTYGLYTHAIWSTTKSFPQTLLWALRQVKISYDTWQGTFSSAFIMALSPAIWGDNCYIWSPIILIAMMVIAHLSLGYVLLVKFLKTSKSIWCIISSLVTFMMIEMMPSPVNAYYWFNGAVHYNFMHSCAILLFTAVLYIEVSHKKGINVALYFVACICSVLCAGSNYSTALFGLLGLSFLVVLKFLVGQKSKWKLLPWGIYVFALYKSVTAYGNTIRQEEFAQSGAADAIFHAFVQGQHWIRHWFTLPVFLFVLLLAPFLWKAVRDTEFRFPLPGMVTLLSFCSVSCMFTPSLYAMGISGPDRLINIIKIWFILVLFVNEGYWLGYFGRCLREKHVVLWEAFKQRLTGAKLCAYCGVIACAILAVFVLKVETRGFDYCSYAAYVSLKAGEAQAFDREYWERVELLESEEEDIVLEPFSVKPWLLFFDDVTEDATDWRNAAVANWYYKKSVVLKKE